MDKKVFAFILAILIIFGTLFTVLFVNLIIDYQSINNIDDNLLYEELHFIKLEKDKHLYFYFSEYDKPFMVSSIANNKINKEALNNITSGDIIKVYYETSKSKNSDYNLCEIILNANYILKLSDYISANKRNMTIGLILCPLLICDTIFLAFILIKSYINIQKELKDISTILGKERIHCLIDGNLIQIFNSFSVCSLIINNKVVDQYIGTVATPFDLKGEINGNIVEAKMGIINMKLYYNRKLIKKIFMGLG